MEKKYISRSRYKKSNSDNKKARRSENNVMKKIKGVNEPVKAQVKIKEKKIKKTNKKLSNRLIIFSLILLAILVLVLLRLKLKEPNESFFDIFGTKIEESIIKKIDIGIIDSVDINDENTSNVILTELNTYTCGMLLRIDSNYNISYYLLENVEKISNKEYILNISKDNTLTANVLKARLNSFNTSSSKYYTNVQNIKSMEVEDSKTLRIILENDSPMFIYNLQLPIISSDGGMYTQNTIRNNQDMLTYISKNVVNIPETINVYKLTSDEQAVELFKKDSINMFVTNNFQISELLGKFEYDIHAYKNGKCLMLFGNKNSDVFSRKEIRQTIAYSIDRDKIKREIFLNSGDIIDLPFIYSDVKYKYDIYGAQNILLTSGYKLQDNVFSKVENGMKVRASLKLIVNKDDETKLKVASYIKEDLKSVGIEINIVTMNKNNLEKALSKGEYDLVLANININENPDLSYIEEYININNNTNNAFSNIITYSKTEEIIENVRQLHSVLSNEVVCIGIHADTSYVICKKELNELGEISYMNIFSKLLLNIDK